ncbi:DUF2441 domain-containing protein [Leptospira noguchii]|uniref:DUF2441 domain-containing protein n=1 Tax=Leptospira noguchii TaxID=28182 RepID=UPI001F05B370|nr:DUF2441 domain-containing protein [Leptospira noguchii]MCH1914743.1 DUF2441 domain-containing protein [Leptospira noguchii]UOG64670.1 DUF2441 domain-containing protein [Leptospira noguchii]
MEKKEYYHIHRFKKNTSPIFQEGNSYLTFEDFNHFWSYFLNFNPYITYDNIRKISPSQYAHECVQKNKIDEVGLKFITNALKESGMYLRELIFEHVRYRIFPHLPSRQYCIWLTEKENIDFWYSCLKDESFSFAIMKLECEGIFHKGNQSFLDSDLSGYIYFSQNAHDYWSSSNISTNNNNEIIFNGTTKILKIEEIRI